MARRNIAQEEFDRKIKVLSIIVPVITCIISVIIAPWLLVHSASANQTTVVTPAPTPAYQISKEDQLELQIIQAKFDVALKYYQNKSDPIRSEEAGQELLILADKESTIMRKYVPNWTSHVPISQAQMGSTSSQTIFIFPSIFLIILFLVLYFGLQPVYRWILRKKYSVTDQKQSP